jgi:hypothetical protein
MADQAPCPRCRHANLPENRFCGWCGAPLGAGNDLMARRAGNLTLMGQALPVKPGPVGKALAVGLGTLAMRAGLSWLHHRITAEDRQSALSTRELGTAVPERLSDQILEKVLIQELGGDDRRRTFAWQAVRSIIVTEWTSSSGRATESSREAWSSGGSRASASPFEPGRWDNMAGS